MKTIETLEKGDYRAILQYSYEFREYRVKFYYQENLQGNADYFTTDIIDAYQTACIYCKIIPTLFTFEITAYSRSGMHAQRFKARNEKEAMKLGKRILQEKTCTALHNYAIALKG
jgi:hypothetical protein